MFSKGVYVIAEIGQNHQGNIEIAKELITAAKKCGVDCVKFQKSHLSDKFNYLALSRPYNSQHSWGATYGEHKNFLELSENSYRELQKYAADLSVDFTASAMDEKSLIFLKSLDVPFIKIGSGDVCNASLLRKASSLNTPLVVSTGMCTMRDVEIAYGILSSGNCPFALLHCVSSYPTPENELNLNVIRTYMEKFPCTSIGYSGHELGIDCTLLAVQMGATIIERHFTLDKNWKGNDHSCSLTPAEMTNLVTSIRQINEIPQDLLSIKYSAALGSGVKEIQPSEQACIDKLGKTLVSAKALAKGTILSADDICIKVAEPKGIHGRHFDDVVGRCLGRDIDNDSSIDWHDLVAD